MCPRVHILHTHARLSAAVARASAANSLASAANSLASAANSLASAANTLASSSAIGIYDKFIFPDRSFDPGPGPLAPGQTESGLPM